MVRENILTNVENGKIAKLLYNGTPTLELSMILGRDHRTIKRYVRCGLLTRNCLGLLSSMSRILPLNLLLVSCINPTFASLIIFLPFSCSGSCVGDSLCAWSLRFSFKMTYRDLKFHYIPSMVVRLWSAPKRTTTIISRLWKFTISDFQRTPSLQVRPRLRVSVSSDSRSEVHAAEILVGHRWVQLRTLWGEELLVLGLVAIGIKRTESSFPSPVFAFTCPKMREFPQ